MGTGLFVYFFSISFFNPDIFIEEVTDFADKFHLKSDRHRNRRNSRRDRNGRSGSRSGSTGDRRRLGRRKTRTDEKGWPGTSWSRGSWFFWQLPEPKDWPRFSIARERKRKETELRFEGSQQPAVGRKKVDSSKLARSGVIPTVQTSSGAFTGLVDFSETFLAVTLIVVVSVAVRQSKPIYIWWLKPIKIVTALCCLTFRCCGPRLEVRTSKFVTQWSL